uniref:PilZ domain-containing protein n=1 Tax=uncultured Sphingomonas sp. TaxID=158754 RepID=UPI0035CBA8A1
MALAAQMICGARADRLSVDLDATLRDAQARPIAVEIEDISATGFRMQTSTLLAVDDEITIGIAGLGMRPARVVRQQDTYYGCLFLESVPQAAIDLLQFGPQETVTQFTAARSYEPEAAPRDDRYPLPVRLAIIVGLAAACWIVLGAVIALVL